MHKLADFYPNIFTCLYRRFEYAQELIHCLAAIQDLAFSTIFTNKNTSFRVFMGVATMNTHTLKFRHIQ